VEDEDRKCGLPSCLNIDGLTGARLRTLTEKNLIVLILQITDGGPLAKSWWAGLLRHLVRRDQASGNLFTGHWTLSIARSR
jgi:hypothetical protein